MRVEIPECLRCCFCFSLRHGILVFGYLHLLFTFFIMSVEAYLNFGHPVTVETMTMFRGVGMWNEMWLTFVLYGLEVIFNLVLIFGAHTRRVILMRVYYYYGIMTTVAALLTYLVVRYENNRDWYFEPFICVTFSAFAIQIYLLFLIRSELQKVRYQEGNIRYVNHIAEVVVDQPSRDGSNFL